MSERFLIMSDLHLGRQPWRVRADWLRPVWDGVDHVIINGDVAELYDPRYIAAAEVETLRLQALCEADGVTLTLLAGNHDPYITEQRHLMLADGKVLVTHGDTIEPAIAPWCATAAVMRETFNKTIASVPIETRESLETRLLATHHAALAKWELITKDLHTVGLKGMLKRPWSFLEVLRYWRRFPTESAKFMERYAPLASVLITGHTHRQGVWQRGHRTIINTGGFAFPAQPRVVLVEGRQLRVHRVTKKANEYRVDAEPVHLMDV